MADLASLIMQQAYNQPNLVQQFQQGRQQALANQLGGLQLQQAQQKLGQQGKLAQLMQSGATPEELIRGGFTEQGKALAEVQGGQMPFEGTGLDAQMYNELLTGDPSSKKYAVAYSRLTQPRTQMTPDGMITITPKLPQDIKPPTSLEGIEQPTVAADEDGFLSANQLKYNQTFNESANLVDAYNSYMDALLKTFPTNATDWADVPARKIGELQSKYTQLTTAMKGKSLLDLGVLAGADLDLIRDIAPDPTGVKANIFGRDYILGATNTLGDNFKSRLSRINDQFSGGNVKTKEIPGIKEFKIGNGGGKDKRPAPMANEKGWRLMTDAAGNRAYVSPDGSQFEEIK